MNTNILAFRFGQTLAMGHYTRVTQAESRMRRKAGRKLEELRRCLLKTEERTT